MDKPLHEAQLDRAKRILEFVKKNKDDLCKSNKLLLSDLMFGFFVICYHVRDWIIKEEGKSVTAIVHMHINDNDCLKVCSDICHTIKHVRPKKILTGRKPVRKIKGIRVNNEFKIELVYDTNVGELECFKLADDCIKAWEELFKII